MSEPTEKRSDLVICGLALIVLGVTLVEPRGGPFSWFVRGWMGVMGLGLVVRGLTIRKSPGVNRILNRSLTVIGLLGLIAAIGYALLN